MKVAAISTIATTVPSPGVLVAGAVGALAMIGALALLMRHRPDAFPLLAIFALPFRLPISTDGRTVNLLIPLYLVIAAGTIVHLLPQWLNRDSSVTPRRSPIALEWLLLGAVVLYALQAIYSTDHAKAAENIAFFYIPFGLLFMLLRDVRWTRELVLRCLGVAVALAVVFAGIGFIEYYRKTLFLNPKVVAADQYGNYFRVNSLFFDPNIYGRFLAIVMIAVTTVVLWTRRRREVLVAAGVLAWLLAGLITSFSQSSIAALLLGMAVLAAYRWDVRATVYVTGALIAIAAVIVLAAPPSLHFGVNGSEWLDQQRHERAHEADLRRSGTVRRSSAIRIWLGLVRNRVSAPRSRERRERDFGLPHDSDHGRRRAGDPRPGRVHRAADRRVRGACSQVPGALPRESPWPRASLRSCCTRGRTPTSWRTRSRGRCWGSASRWHARALWGRPGSRLLRPQQSAPVGPHGIAVGHLTLSGSAFHA